MKKINFYLFKNSCLAIFMTTLGLLAISVFLKLLEEQGEIQGNYNSLQTIYYVLLLAPSMLCQIFPASCLIGTVISLGNLANNRELVIMEASGINKFSILLPVLLAVFLQVLIVSSIGEFIAPIATEQAKIIKFSARAPSKLTVSKQGLWLKVDNNFINIGQRSGLTLKNVTIYSLQKNSSPVASDPYQYQLTKIAFAQSAQYQDHAWKLNNYQESFLANSHIETHKYSEITRADFIDPKLISVLSADPNELSLINLRALIKYSRENSLSYDNYTLMMWDKIFAPLVTMIMVLFAVPLVFGNLRHINLGLRIFIAILIGLSYFLISHLTSNIVLIFNFPPLISALLPIIIFGGISTYLLIKDANVFSLPKLIRKVQRVAN